MIYKYQPDRLAARRKSAGLTQPQLADIAGVSVATIRRWEAGKGEPTTTQLMALSRLVKSSLFYIMGVHDDPAFIGISTIEEKEGLQFFRSFGWPTKAEIELIAEYRDNMRQVAEACQRAMVKPSS